MNETLARAHERRLEVRAHAASIGINEAYVSTLVDSFYAAVRKDPVLGAIFDRAIGDRWDDHLPRMKRFWSSVAMNTGTYSGKPVPAHQKLTGIEPAHFTRWLALFRQTLEATAPSPEAADYFMVRAGRIAESLQLAMFGFEGLPVKRA